ncbi:MAG: hypothetical protein GXO08_03995 [Aquificae bacterium]|nr:hypothetical protein [Aquificota bacterium]
MKILLITFDKEMEEKIRNLLKDYQIIVAKNGEEALLMNVGSEVGLIIYDALAGGIAEEDINRLYDEGFKDVPYIILMDDLFPIDPNNLKPPKKRVISREVEVERLPELVKELLEEKPAEAPAAAPAAETEKAAPAETSWDELLKQEGTEEKKVEEAAPAVQESAPPPPESLPLKKRCLLVSFDMPLVEKIERIIGDRCELLVARSAKQALQKYKGQPFDVIIFDTISGVFAEKGIKDLYEKGGYKDTLYVVLLDEMLPIDVDKLPVKNLRAIKRESELDLLPEIIESAPHVTFEKALEQAAPPVEAAPPPPPPVEEKREEVKPEAVKQAPPKEERVEEVTPPPAAPAAPATPPAAPAAARPAPVDEELVERLVEQKINEKLLPLIEELVRSKLSEAYLKELVREVLGEKVSDATVREVVREVAEPLVREVIQELLS